MIEAAIICLALNIYHEEIAKRNSIFYNHIEINKDKK